MPGVGKTTFGKLIGKAFNALTLHLDNMQLSTLTSAQAAVIIMTSNWLSEDQFSFDPRVYDRIVRHQLMQNTPAMINELVQKSVNDICSANQINCLPATMTRLVEIASHSIRTFKRVLSVSCQRSKIVGYETLKIYQL